LLVNDRVEYVGGEIFLQTIDTVGCRLSPMLCGQQLNKRLRSASVVDEKPTYICSRVSRKAWASLSLGHVSHNSCLGRNTQ
jgi:hypothetical protein